MTDQKTPVTEYQETKEAAATARKQKEIDLWQTWKSNGMKPHHLEPLLKLYEGNLAQKTKLWKAPTVPASAFKMTLQEHLIDAFKSYDPSKGAALNTHVENRLHKAKRYNARMQNLAYLPEGQISGISPINKAFDILSEDLGRQPTDAEIAEHLRENNPRFSAITTKRVETIRRAQRKDVPGSSFESDPTPRTSNYEEEQIEIAAGILPQLFPNKPELHTLFGHVFGMNGHEKITSTTALAKKMGKTQQQVARMKTTLGNTLKEQMGLDAKEE